MKLKGESAIHAAGEGLPTTETGEIKVGQDRDFVIAKQVFNYSRLIAWELVEGPLREQFLSW